jgi:high-affinity iron transporter
MPNAQCPMPLLLFAVVVRPPPPSPVGSPINSLWMHLRTILNYAAFAAFLAMWSVPAPAQEHPARRLSSIVGVAVEEYAKGIDESGKLISQLEYQEAVDFLADAKTVAERLSGERAGSVRAVLDTLNAAVHARKPASEIAALHARFVTALGNEGALELPTAAIDLAAGRAIYQRSCASCHGDRGLGDGPAATGMNPAPPAIGRAADMVDATPALLYRVLSVGIPGTAMAGWSDRLTVQERWNVVAYVQSMRAHERDVLEGEGLFLQRCSACHGATGAADGSASAALTRLPPEIGSFAWQAERSDLQLGAVIRTGIEGTAMPRAPDLGDAELAKVVAYVRSLPIRSGDVPTAAAGDTTPAGVARTVMATLDKALAAAQAGRTSDAGDLAFDAYIAFEPLERTTRAKNPGLVASLERHFAEFKGAAKANDLRAARNSRDAIEAGLPAIVDLTRSPSGDWAAFFQSFLIILREGFEAILVLGAVITFLIRTGNRQRLRSIWVGAGAGLAASALTAVVLRTVLKALPATQEVIEGVTMLIAVLVLFSVSYWLISKVEAAKWQQFIREKVASALDHGGGTALAFVAFLAVYREGAETALFYQALFGEGKNVMVPIALGIVVGAVALAVVFTLFYRFGVRLPLRPFFAVTSVMLYYMAFVFLGKGIRELQEGNIVPITVIPGFPNIEMMGIYATVETLLAQLVLIALFVFALVKTFWPRRAVTLPSAPTVASQGAAPAPVPDAARVAALQDAVSRLEARIAELEREAGAVTRD